MAVHIKNLKIDSYRGVKNLELNNLADINVLTGDNNTGKTSILEVLRSLNSPTEIESWHSSLRMPEAVLNSNNLSFFESTKMLFNIENNIIKYNYVIEEETEITIKNEIEDISLSGDSINKLSAIELFEKNKLYPLKKMNLYFYKNEELVNEETIYEIRHIRNKNKLKNKIFNTIYVSPFQHIEETMYLDNVLNEPILYQEMLEVLKEFDDNIISINAGKSGNSVVYKILSKTGSLPLNVYGDGMKKAILLISAVVKAKNGILLLDEFETAIHTTAMNKVFSWILKSCLKLNVQLFLTSHSKEATEKILNCCPELQEKINLYTLYKKETQTVARRLAAKQAIEVYEDFGLELR